jgi:hypothetical protein
LLVVQAILCHQPTIRRPGSIYNATTAGRKSAAPARFGVISLDLTHDLEEALAMSGGIVMRTDGVEQSSEVHQ